MSDPKEKEVQAILQAIDYGHLPPRETQRRLLNIIQAEALERMRRQMKRKSTPAWICWNVCKVNRSRLPPRAWMPSGST